MIRNSCALCENSILDHVYTQKMFPVSFAGNYGEFIDLEWVSCSKCDIVQLSTLVSPEVLYQNSHNNTYDTPTWKKHHELFSEFIETSTKTRNFLEIGAGSNILADSLDFEDYTILDMAEVPQYNDKIKYVQGNCEDYHFENDCLILSHVFEHLYSPSKFIENIKATNVKEIFISVPNLEILIEKRSLSFIHNEHTYFFTEQNIEEIFNKNGYIVSKKFVYKDHSIFYYFTRGETLFIREKTHNVEKITEYFQRREQIIGNILLTKPTYIVPGGHFGTVMFYYLKNKEFVQGFLDNDKTKQGKFHYNEELKVYSFDHLENAGAVDILLHAGPYTEEIETQLKKYSNVNIIKFSI